MKDTIPTPKATTDAAINPFHPLLAEKPVSLPAMTLRSASCEIGTSEPEMQMLLTLRQWTHAQANPLVRARLEALDEIKHVMEIMDNEDEEALTGFFDGYHPGREAMFRATFDLYQLLTCERQKQNQKEEDTSDV